MGYNYGARNKERLIKAFKVAFLVALVIMTLGLIRFQLLPYQLVSIFNASDGMYEIGVRALRIISLCFIPASFGILASSFFQATGHGVMSLWASLIRQMIGILPLAWIFARVGGLELVWFAFPIAEIMGIVFSIIAMRYIFKKDIARLAD